jgi:hypothetical protein
LTAMILFDLTCRNGHVFEGWFRDGAAYEAQRRGRKVTCPVCGSAKIAKAPMAPAISIGQGGDKPAANRKRISDTMRELRKLREQVEANCEYVGPRFPEEARAIHYGESEKTGVYGEASPEEARELSEEGIPVARIPWVPRQDS